LVNDKVVFDDGTFVDHAYRRKARKWLHEHTSDFVFADTARAEVATESLLRRAGFDTHTANFVAAGWSLSVVTTPRTR
jgi:predicted kinase